MAGHFNKEEYPVLFLRIRPLIENYLDYLPDYTDLAEEATKIIDEVERNMNTFRWRFQKTTAFENDKIVLLLFVVPACMEIDTPKAFALANNIADEWNRRFPDSTFKIGNYNDIMDGFEWKLGFGKKD